MKRIFTIIIQMAAGILLTAGVFAQAPEKMSYQAVVRGVTNELIIDQEVGMQISILQGSASGTAVYVETQTPTTNSNGLVSIEIGAGNVVTGNFTTIDWTSGPYFIKTETDPDGGISYTITGTSQLLSVPYALHSKTAESVTGEITEIDPLFTASPAAGIVQGDIDNWDASYGAGDPIDVAEVIVQGTPVIDPSGHWVGHPIDETDPSVPSGTQTGEMQYWDGSQWITVAAGNEGQVLTFTGGVPTWTTTVGANDVQNPSTGEIWMDRNLGASQVATSSTDAAAYGDLYQWGRAADGHESRTSGTTTTLSDSDTPGHGDFITNNSSPYDWRNPQNDNLWQSVSGTNNPCPSVYRLPTEAEWEAERTSWSSNNSAGAFDSPLKLPVAGSRLAGIGLLFNVGSGGHYWSSTIDGTYSRYMQFATDDAGMFSYERAHGSSVRCIKD